jgi:Spy/CpxP family protein refolding chaperone
MNYFSKKNGVIVVIAVLLIINIATISTIVYHSYGNKKVVNKSQTERTSSRDFKRDLNFSPEQIKVLDELAKEFRESTIEMLMEMQNTRIELFNEISSAHPDTARMFAIADEIGILHAKIKRQTINHFLVIKEKSTPEQFDRFVKIFQRAIMEDDFGRWSRGQGQNRRSMNKRSERNK